MNISPTFVKALPKADLHSHIDGTVPLAEVFRIARNNRVRVLTGNGSEIDSPSKLVQFVRGRGYNTLLEDIVNRFYPIVGVMQREAVLNDVGRAYVNELQRQNVVYAEGRFAPQYHTREGLRIRDIVRSMLEGIQAGCEETGLEVNLIVAIGRESPAEVGDRIAKDVIGFHHERVVGLDLGGPELGNPPARFQSSFEMATRAGLHRTVHAGEGAGSRRQNLQNVRDSLELLNAERIGHAIDLASDSGLVRTVAKNQTTIEMNPLSNLILQKIMDLRELKIDTLMARGVRVTVNSDDPALWPRGSISEVLLRVSQAYDLKVDGLVRLIMNSFQGAFIPHERREALTADFLKESRKLEKQ
jgi:adenosine deaminase